MDELLHHCLRELSFDGDLGCNVTRLKDFIIGCYANTETPVGQNLDDAFCAFVWSLVAQHPTVHVGLKPPGVTSEVWIAPQASAKRKGKAGAEGLVETPPSKLVPILNAKGRPLADLIQQYGDDLRIAVEPDAIYAAITGTHLRSSKLSPMVYSAMQVITRGRDNGVSVVELGQQTKYDQKTCFYLVKQLMELDLVVKVRRGGVGTHFVIHKYFFERSPSWKAIREEEEEAEGNQRTEDKQLADAGEELECGTTSLGFTSIDARHLSSLPLIRARVVKLLQASKNHIHPSNNLLVTVGFANPTKTDRRFFQSRIRELLHEGIVEKVIVPSQRRKSGNAFVKCLRLVSEENRLQDTQTEVFPDVDDERDEGGQEGIKVNITLHRQMVNLLEAAGPDGLTLQDLSMALCDFDKRTIELLLTRAEKYPPPAHIKDVGVKSLMETSGRERRHRYYTTNSYQALLTKENFESAPEVSTSDDLAFVGTFSEQDANSFYGELGVLQTYQDGYKEKTRVVKPRKKPPKNPILPDGRVKRGRPRKRPIEEVADHKDAEPTVAVEHEPRPSKRRRLDPLQQESADTGQLPVTPQKKGGKSKSTPSSSVVAKSQKRTRAGERSLPATTETSSRKRVKPSDSEKASLPTTDISILSSSQNVSSAIEAVQGRIDTTGENVQAVVNEADDDVRVSRRSASNQATIGAAVIHDGRVTSIIEGSMEDSVPIDPELLVQQERTIPDSSHHKPVQNSPSASRAKINVSHLRRENELYRVVVEQGGIVNMQSKEFHTAYKVLIEAMNKAGESTSAPVGTTIDKRTLATTLESLERRGRIKQLKTSVVTYTGASRPVCVVYLSDTPQDKLNSFLADLSRVQLPPLPSSSYVKIDEQVEFGADLSRPQQSVLPVQLSEPEQPEEEDKKERWAKNVSKAKQLFSYDDDTIRSVLLTERTTLAQCYGFIVGKVARARHLHISTLNAFQTHRDIPGIICHEHRTVDLAYYCHEIPLELYCSLISVLSYDEESKQFLNTEDGRRTTVRDLPAQLHSALQIGRSRARSRLAEILDFLSLLGLVVPMQPSASELPPACCMHSGDTSALAPASSLSSSDVSSSAIRRWRFCSQAPVRVWGLVEKTPPVWKQAPIVTEPEGQAYWRALHQACTDPDAIPPLNPDNVVDLPDPHINLGRILRRTSSWASEYVFTWHQTQYMKQSVDTHTGRTPLQEENEEARASKINRISRIISVPEESVRHFYSSNHTRMVLELEKARNRAMQRRSERSAKATTEAKALLAKKAAEAKRQREEDWDKLMSRLHPSPLPTAAAVRIKRIRTRFMQAMTIQNHEKWENEILESLREAEVVTKKLLRTSDTVNAVQLAPPTSNAQRPLNGEKSVELLIAQQGPAVPPRKRKGKGKSKASQGTDGTEEKRRHRFQWNHDYDELARDASAIIKARCRALSRLDWGAFEQVFPAVPRNTVRQRLAHLRDSPGNEAYLNRLEERWHELWLQYRGTLSLPDDDPLSPTNFDLAKHIEFMRAHIDKNALRVGFAQPQEKTNLTIPSSVDELLDKYTVIEPTLSAPVWDFMWNAAVEESREKRLVRQSFVKKPEEVDTPNLSPETVNTAEAALKMSIGTPHERYDHERASNLLRSIGDSVVESARNNLLARGVLSKLVRDPQKQKPGRQLKISEINQNATGGPVIRHTFQDAAALEELSRKDHSWREWPLLATDGDTAALIDAVSNGKVRFKIDTSHAQSARPQLDWNSKKADDDQIETAIFVQFDLPTIESLSTLGSPDEIAGDIPPHSSVAEGIPRCCKGRALNELIDCGTCLEDEWNVSILSEEENDLSRRIVDVVREAGADGLTKLQLRELKDSLNLTEIELFGIVHRLTDAPTPFLFWTGYNNIVIVHSTFLARWTVVVSDDPLTRSHPRRWYDINGCRVPGYWQAALRAVMGVVIFRPGITQSELRWRLRSVYDRQEINEILRHLDDEKYLCVRQKDESWLFIHPLDEEEESEVFWFIGDRPWYHV